MKTIDEIKSSERKAIISGPFGSNISAKYFVPSGVPVIRGNNLSLDLGTKFNDTGFVFVTQQKADALDTWAEKDDIIFTAVGTIGQVGILTGEEKYQRYIISNKQLRLRVDKSIVEPLFAYYWFASPEMIDTIVQRNTGSSVPLINLSVLKSLHIPLLDLKIQKEIVEILSSLDDKIDLLHRQNKTLEEMAEVLWRKWFVEEAEESIEKIRLEQIVDQVSGISYKGNDLQPSTIGMITLKNFDRNGGFRHDGYKEYVGTFKDQHVVIPGDLLVAHTDITQDAEVIGNPILIPSTSGYSQMIFSMDLVKVIAKHKEYTNAFLYFLMRTREFKEHCLGYANGSTVLHLSKRAIPEFEFKKPAAGRVSQFSIISTDLLKKLDDNQRQIQCLAKMRDSLLPKLMSGEINIK